MGLPSVFGPTTEVALSNELMRIVQMPRRVLAEDEELAELARELTDILKLPNGAMTLRPLQAAALMELGRHGGLFGPLRVGSGKCVTGDTEIFDVSKGRRREVAELGVCRVVTKDAEGKLVTAPALLQMSGRKECVVLTLRDGSQVCLTKDHPVFTNRGWVPAAEISDEHLVATSRFAPEPDKYTEATDDEVILAAYLLSDGSVSQRATSFTNASEEIIEEFSRVVNRVADASKNLNSGWKKEGVTSVSRPSRAYELSVAGLSWYRRKWGINGLSRSKRLPAAFWGLPRRQLALFLNRFWACDGWISPSGPSTILASEKLIDDLRFLLLRLGVQSRKRFKKAVLHGREFPAWRLTVPAHCIEDFFAEVGLIFTKEKQSLRCLEAHRSMIRNTNVDVVPVSRLDVPRICDELGFQGVGGDWKQRPGRPRTELAKFLASSSDQNIGREKFAAFCRQWDYRGQLAWYATSDLCWERVERLEEVGVKEVYDLSVPGFGCFVGNNIILHNTLISFLAPLVCFAKRPLLVIPADLVEKTERDRRNLSQHWDMPGFLRVMTYEWLGRKQAADALEKYMPDCCIYDEAHRLRNTGAAVTRRARRFHSEYPETIVLVMSGTIIKRSLHDYWHLIRWSLGPDRMFLPRSFLDVEQWAQALDVIKGETKRTHPGALKVLCNEEELQRWDVDPLGAARTALRRRMIETPGVVASGETEVDATLTVNSVECRVSPAVDTAFGDLRTRWELPDGRIVLPEGRKIKDGLGMYRHARELALGFYYIWEPQPPRYWIDARKNWHKFVRKILSHSRTLDSESQVRDAHADNPELLGWLRVQDDFEPKTVAVWIDDSVLEYCAAWAERKKGIIWTEHVAFGERLARESGLTYYGKKGFSASGAYIEDHPPDRALIAGFQSNHRGKCLEKWSTNLVTSCPANGLQAEQLIGRTHREGQEADEVVVDVLALCAEHVGAFWQAHNDARMVEDSMASQKLLLAGLNVMTADELAQRSGPRWRKDWAGSLTAA